MKKIFGVLAVLAAVMILLPVLQMCNVPAMQAQAMLEMAEAQSETAKAAQEAANSANTLAWTLGGSVFVLALAAGALIGLVVFLRVRRELNGEATLQAKAQPVGPRLIVRPDQPQLLAAGDPMQSMQQLMMMQMMRDMQRDARAQLPQETLSPTLSLEGRGNEGGEEDWL